MVGVLATIQGQSHPEVGEESEKSKATNTAIYWSREEEKENEMQKWKRWKLTNHNS